MELNTTQNFWQKGIHSPFWILASRGQKTLTHPMKNLTFWMELNTPMKILAFCISSFQSSWHFAFCIPWGTKHSLNVGANLYHTPMRTMNIPAKSSLDGLQREPIETYECL
jgi:hypothetical protein